MSSFDGEDPSSLRRRIVPKATERKRLRFQVRPVLRGQLGRMLAGFAAFEVGNVAATLLILRATDLLIPGQASTQQRGPLLVTAPGVFAWPHDARQEHDQIPVHRRITHCTSA